MFDIAVVAAVGILTFLGFWKGLVRQVVGLVGVVVAYVVAMKFSGALAAKFLKGFLPVTGHVISFLALFFACVIVASVFGWILGRLMSSAGLGVLNRIGGGVLGGAKGCLIVAVVTMLLTAYLPRNSGFLEGSRTMKYIQPVARMISEVAPEGIKMKYDEKTQRPGRTSGKRQRKRIRESVPQDLSLVRSLF
jgi:membrane protein required for colicin V production